MPYTNNNLVVEGVGGVVVRHGSHRAGQSRPLWLPHRRLRRGHLHPRHSPQWGQHGKEIPQH